MLVFTITVEEVESCYDEEGLYFDEDEGVWYCVDEDGVEYWFDEESDDWVECEYDEMKLMNRLLMTFAITKSN